MAGKSDGADRPGKQPSSKARGAAKQRQARQETSESSTRATIALLERQAFFLDRAAAEISATTGAHLMRESIIRALVDALERSGFDVSSAGSEEALADLLTARLSAGNGEPRA
jgi:hypothetical protein